MYINIIIIYSIANLHDVSWGNRETSEKKGGKVTNTETNLEQFRSIYLILWLFLNACYGYGITYITQTGQMWFMYILLVSFQFS